MGQAMIYPCKHCSGSGLDNALCGAEVRRWREGAELSLRQLAKRLRFTPSYLSDLEHGRRNWSLAMLHAAWDMTHD